MSAKVIVKVKPNGESTVEASNVQGTACSLHTAPFIAALGKRGLAVPKPEMFAEAQAEERQEARQ